MLGSINPFFCALPDRIKNQLGSAVPLIELPRGVSAQSFDKHAQIYFPVSCVFSISAYVPNLPHVFMKFAGSGLMIGLSSLFGTDVIYESRVIGRGYAYKMSESHLLSTLDTEERLGSLKYHSVLTVVELAMISAACGTTHTTSQRLARTLLEASDAFGRDQPITLTQAELARLLSVTRESVVGLLKQWSRAGTLTHRRGQISVDDRSRLLDLSCQCYESVQKLEARALQRWKEVKWAEVSRSFLTKSPANGFTWPMPPRRST